MSHFIRILVPAFFFVMSQALICRYCKTTLPPTACNSTHCVIDCDVKTCEVGLCHTSVIFNDTTGHQVHAVALCQSGSQPAHVFFSRHQIEGYCRFLSTDDVSCECGLEDCNHVINFPSRDLLSTTDPINKDEGGNNPTITLIIGSVAALAFVAILIIAVLLIYKRRRSRFKDAEFESKLTGNRLSSDDSTDLGWEDSNRHSNCSTCKYSTSGATQYSRGSRSNGAIHEQRLPIQLEKIIGRGRFAEVWKGNLQQDPVNSQVVSVKVFQLRNYGAWRQEKDMLMENWMRHDNIIAFYASEKRTIKGRLQYWLVTDYYERGSLADFLREQTLEWQQFCNMAIAIANGLAYLHSERDSSGRAKIPIAHRDVKSCNILVTSDSNSCVLADFGLSLKLDPDLTADELSNAGQVGTSRYMAPELLERLVNLTDIELFKRVDVYALALVYWEMANRCEAEQGMAAPYKPPFGDQINDHPTKQQMLLLVCRDRQLPSIPSKWKSHQGLSKFIDEILSEAWEHEPEARITAQCIFERFVQLREDCVINIVDDDKAKLREKTENEMNKLATEIMPGVM